MVSDSTLDGIVHDVRYKFSNTGEVISTLVLNRPGHNVPYFCEIKCLQSVNTQIARGDHVRISISTNNTTNEITILKRNTDTNCYPTFMIGYPYCPYCGTKLHYNMLYGECHTKICPAQISNNIQIFAQGIGLFFHGSNKLIFNNLLTRGVFRDYIDIFNTTINTILDLDNIAISNGDMNLYINTINSFKGTINLFQILNGFNIPYLTVQGIDQIIQTHTYTTLLKAIPFNKYLYVDGNADTCLKAFFSNPCNTNSYAKLASVATDGVFVMG